MLNFSSWRKKIYRSLLSGSSTLFMLYLWNSKKVIKQLPIFFNETNLITATLHICILWATDIMASILFNMMDTTIHAIDHSVSTANSVAMSTNSSGSGLEAVSAVAAVAVAVVAAVVALFKIYTMKGYPKCLYLD
jgi:hypothetical protein